MNLYQHALDDIHRRKLIRSLAHAKHHRPDHCNVNTDTALVTETKNGAWVAAQVWVSFEGTELDKRRARLSQAGFVANEGRRCPMCLSVEVRCAGTFEATGNVAEREAECNDCGATWVDVYHLTGYDALHLKDGTIAIIPEQESTDE